MKDKMIISLFEDSKNEIREILNNNKHSSKFGLILSKNQIETLIAERKEILKDTGRLEIGESVLSLIVNKFCDSQYLWQDNYYETISEVQNIFFIMKNESMEMISDKELIDYLYKLYNGKAKGSLEYIMGVGLDVLIRSLKSMDFDISEVLSEEEFEYE